MIKINGTEIILVKEGIEKQSTDGIISWIYPDMISGPKEFGIINYVAGPQLKDHILSYEVGINNIKPGDCFVTQAGMLECKVIFHSIISTENNSLHNSFLNILMSIETYKTNNILRDISIYIPCTPNLYMEQIINILTKLDLTEIRIVCKPEDYNVIENFLESNNIKLSIINRINNFIDNLMLKIGKIKWSFKKKLPLDS